MVIAFKSKKGIISYASPFVFGPEYLRMFKVTRSGEEEGVMAYIHPDDAPKYDDDFRGPRLYLAVSNKETKQGMRWGCVFPYRFKGIDVPECDMVELMDMEQPPMYHKELFDQTLRLAFGDLSRRTNLKKSMPAFARVLGEDHEIVRAFNTHKET